MECEVVTFLGSALLGGVIGHIGYGLLLGLDGHPPRVGNRVTLIAAISGALMGLTFGCGHTWPNWPI